MLRARAGGPRCKPCVWSQLCSPQPCRGRTADGQRMDRAGCARGCPQGGSLALLASGLPGVAGELPRSGTGSCWRSRGAAAGLGVCQFWQSCETPGI